ncbi:hypothetical protein [Campylobacter jejuni]|nr:hypothetical protein [Campylobacter jejuni]EAQ60146.1 peptide symporter family protein [Campylobacter jejuni subsp. jejuni HB93-13]EPW32824.1 peptide symporter family protein [Campylobacter jejuni BJ-CJD101]KAJ9948689.1 hypothetical protein QR498_01065 [Campylobacter jejuni]PNS86028.1 peptide symporter family protein [Campylobacter jejuni HB-CJGB-ZB]PNS87353.1 peptide symporter family protein [Campylobacter jejuni HB-CJGB-ZHX]
MGKICFLWHTILLVLFMATTISKGGLGISTEYASAIYGIFQDACI